MLYYSECNSAKQSQWLPLDIYIHTKPETAVEVLPSEINVETKDTKQISVMTK